MKIKEDPSISVEDWQVRDYRNETIEALFSALHAFGLNLTKASFRRLADSYDSPEELTSELPSELDQKKKEIYLTIFELWRRLLPNRVSISIFCDTLDYLIIGYEQNPDAYDEKITSALVELADILDSNVDTGQKPKMVFQNVASFAAHDLEHFLYNYIFDQIEKERETLASEMLGDFYDYVKDKAWFDFLRIKLLQGALTEEASAMLARFLQSLREKPNLELYFELLHYLAQIDHKELFTDTFRHVLSLIKMEEEYLEMMDILFEFYTLYDLEEEEDALKEYIEKRREIPFHKKISQEDKKHLDNLLI